MGRQVVAGPASGHRRAPTRGRGVHRQRGALRRHRAQPRGCRDRDSAVDRFPAGELAADSAIHVRTRSLRGPRGIFVADGQHARADALTSLGVLGSVAGVWLGFPLADPIVGLAITAVILRIVWQSGKIVLARVADGVDPQVISAIEAELDGIPGVERVATVRARWLGHRMRAEVTIAVDGGISVTAGHAIAEEVRRLLLDRLPYLSDVIVHVDPEEV